MKKLVIFVLFLLPLAVFGQEKITATYYYSTQCKHCLDLKRDFLPKIMEKYSDNVDWRQVQTNDQSGVGLQELIGVMQYFQRGEARVPAIAVGDNLLIGTVEILPRLEESLQRAIDTQTQVLPQADIDMIAVFNQIPLAVIVVSGLIDGINPCAFAVIIFFVSFLAVYGYRRREIIYVGSAYCLAVFITYFFIGLGLFRFLYAISHMQLLIKGFYYFVGFFCLGLGLVALYDFYRYKRTGSSKEQLLQLPGFFKKRINTVIGSRLRDKNKKTPLKLVISSFSVGFIVSLLEAICTGQVYVPVVVSILKYPHLRAKALFYLLIYNLMFIMPLVLIFILSLAGMNSKIFDRFLRKHLGLIKILLAVVFIGLGFFVIGYDYIYTHILPFFHNLMIRWIG